MHDNRSYKFKWKRNWFKHSQRVIGHTYDTPSDKMILYLPNGGLREIKKWSECEIFLGEDWKIAVDLKVKETTGK